MIPSGYPLACRFVGPRDTAAEVLAAATAAGYYGLHALPFNRFSPDDTTWWLVPTTDIPAYKHGKIIFTRRDAAPGNMFVGLYIEKGVGPAAASMYQQTAKGRRYVLDRTWLWNRFVGALGSGEFEHATTAAQAGVDYALTIAIDAAVVPPPAGRDEIHSPDLPRDVVRFQLAEGGLTFLDADTPAGLLKPLGKPETLPVLAARIGALPQLDWIWIDFHVGLRFMAVPDTRGPGIWSAGDLWQRACLPWKAWLH